MKAGCAKYMMIARGTKALVTSCAQELVARSVGAMLLVSHASATSTIHLGIRLAGRPKLDQDQVFNELGTRSRTVQHQALA